MIDECLVKWIEEHPEIQRQLTLMMQAEERNGTMVKQGRPSKKDYDASSIMETLIADVAEVYNEIGTISGTAEELMLSPNTVKKLLITGGLLRYEKTEQIQSLLRTGLRPKEVATKLLISVASLNTYIPYSKTAYNTKEISQNAERVKLYKARKAAAAAICDEESLWDCIVLFEGYQFYTVTGLAFRYMINRGKNGELTKELIVDRREESKSLAWSSVMLAYENSKKMGIIERPKAIGDIRGISYVYSILWRFGLIQVPPMVEKKMKGT